jgi:hypothetical protein
MGHNNAVEVPRHVAQGHEEAVTGEVIRSDRGRLGTVAGVYPRRGFLLDPRRYPHDPSTNHDGMSANPCAARRRRVSEPVFPGALYHGEVGSVGLTYHIQGKFSLNFVWQHIQGSAAKL